MIAAAQSPAVFRCLPARRLGLWVPPRLEQARARNGLFRVRDIQPGYAFGPRLPIDRAKRITIMPSCTRLNVAATPANACLRT